MSLLENACRNMNPPTAAAAVKWVLNTRVGERFGLNASSILYYMQENFNRFMRERNMNAIRAIYGACIGHDDLLFPPDSPSSGWACDIILGRGRGCGVFPDDEMVKWFADRLSCRDSETQKGAALTIMSHLTKTKKHAPYIKYFAGFMRGNTDYGVPYMLEVCDLGLFDLAEWIVVHFGINRDTKLYYRDNSYLPISARLDEFATLTKSEEARKWILSKFSAQAAQAVSRDVTAFSF